MKKLVTGLTAIAAVVGVTSAFAFAPKKFLPNIIYGELGSDNKFHYFTSAPGVPFGCSTYNGAACTFSSTKTVTFFNDNKQLSFPQQSTTSPIVNWGLASNKIYQE